MSEPIEDLGWTDPHRKGFSDIVGENQEGLFRESRQGTDRGFDAILGVHLDKSPKEGDDTLFDLAVLYAVFDQMYVLILNGFLDHGKHGGSLIEMPLMLVMLYCELKHN